MMSRPFGILLFLTLLATLGCSKGSPNGPPTPTGPGFIELVTIPGSATARLDGGAPVYTNARFDYIAAGAHQIAISLLGYADTSVSVIVPAAAVVVDTVRLRPLPGTPPSLTEVWSGFFFRVGPLAVSPTGNFHVTAISNQLSVLAVMAPSGAILRQSLIPDPDASPAFDIALDSQNKAFVASKPYGNVIFIFDANGSFITSVGRRPNGGSDGLDGFAIGPGDTIHVSARYAGMPVVEKYTPQGAFLYAFPTGAGHHGPLEVGGDGSVYVGTELGSTSPQIRKYSRTGTLVQSWSVGGAVGAITKGLGGNLYVSSYLEMGSPSNAVRAPGRMEVFTAAGTRLAQWAIENQGILYLRRHGVDAAGNIYLPLSNDRRVLRYGFE